jgi:protein involved in polysaccharide export with SLBB domain
VRQLLHEKGFGTRAQGVATSENYVAGGDVVQFILDPMAQLTPGAALLGLLAVPQPIGIDGTLMLPYIGPMYVLGLTESELTSAVTDQLQLTFKFPVRLQARVIVNAGKSLYVFGESPTRRFPLTVDLTLLDAMSRMGWTSLANLGRVRVTRPDAQNPLQMEINLREMIETGLTNYNIRLQENDIIYVPPTFFGALTRFLQKLLEPLRVVVASMFGIANVEFTYDVLTNRSPYVGGGGFFF